MEIPFRPQLNRNDVEYEPNRFNVGVDFGSTYSAATFVLLSASNNRLLASDIKMVLYRAATGQNRANHCEVPTVLRYEDICTRWGWDAKLVEESGDAPSGTFVDMIKLLLDEAELTDEVYRDLHRQRVLDNIRHLNKTVIDLLVDFLTPFFKHIMNFMTANGDYDPRDNIELECTVPAIWKETARRKMLIAIDKAGQKSGFGFGKAVWFVSEPEAAASYVLKMNPNWHLQEGENILLCDAGGGTVDLITYTVTNQKPLRVQEAVGGTGCFEQTLQRLDRAKFVDGKKSQEMKLQIAKNVTLHFEKFIKPTFEGEGDLKYNAPVPRLMANPDDEFRDDLITFTPERLNLIFDPVIRQVWDLIQSQLESARCENFAVQKVCLVGGFGGSPRLRGYLKEMLNGWVAKHSLRSIDFFVPDAPDIAIAYGATLRSMDKKNGAPRKCRSSLGIATSIEYDKSSAAHKNATPENFRFVNKKYVCNCLDWMFKLGEIIPPTKVLRERTLHHNIGVNEDTVTLYVMVYSSNTNRHDYYPIDHAKNHDHVEIEKVEFTLDMTKFRDKLVKMTEKQRRTRGPARKHPQGPSGAQRKSSRKRVPTTKASDSQNISGPTGDDSSPQLSPSGVCSLDTPSSQNTPGSSQRRQPSIPSPEPNHEESSASPTDDNPTLEQYYSVGYKFVMEVDGLIIKYRMEIPDANECVEGEINLAHILPPGSSSN
ncbi:uncharacterized protein BP5553_06452 [Venustampulla echinocandica]|uniref:Actin-like ATPase n=1 Tax=Venustampulla echinocandica TaxID=2656787 RepID=A0A370TJY8_9HELO|nr:uncharacterized protein BP5553_06452 [Venustampulla echinocandica]RDL35840.1 hypothetical protein BP5553_06452 [Venustampulla echinocandica]